MRRGVPFPVQPPKASPIPVIEPIQMVIEADGNGMMKVKLNRPVPYIQIIGLLLDCMQGQYQAMAQESSMLIDPNRSHKENHAGEEKENHDNRGGDSSGGTSGV